MLNQVSTYLTDEEKELFIKVCKKEDRKPSVVIRRFVRELISDGGHK